MALTIRWFSRWCAGFHGGLCVQVEEQKAKGRTPDTLIVTPDPFRLQVRCLCCACAGPVLVLCCAGAVTVL